MRHFLAWLFLFLASFSFVSAADNLNSLPIKPQIVGGEVSNEGDWPWMSALVYTQNQIETSLNVNNVVYITQSFNFSPTGDASGTLVDCGIGDFVCEDANQNICLIERGDIDFSVKVNNCQAGGGIGAIIYNNVDGIINGTLGDDFDGVIPVVAVSQADGVNLLTDLGTIASLSVSSENILDQTSTCGATFIGERWVMTAAHCVDDVSITQLKVNVGEYDLSDGAENAVAVKRIYMHPNFDAESLDSDIALIELSESVDNPKITLIDDNLTSQLLTANSDATAMGWGGRVGYEPGEGPTSDFPDVLHQVDLQLLTNNECTDLVNLSLTNNMFCAGGNGGKGTCQGDSGGPVIVETNEGWQQIGIVSFGIGCAAEGYPGGYTRASVFKDWIDEIMQGIAIEQVADFHITPQGQSSTQVLNVVNNSELSANLSFNVSGDNSFSLNTDNCATLLAGASCQLTVIYDANSVGKHNADLLVTSDNSDQLTSSAKLVAQSIALSASLANVLSPDSSLFNWYTGGDNSWEVNNVTSGVNSGAIENLQESIIMAVIESSGTLSFDWSVSSEENVDDPESPYDALYLYVNGEQVDFISGEVDFTSYALSLTDDYNKVTWIYRKDPATAEFEDKGFIQNITFNGEDLNPPPVDDTNTNTNSSGASQSSSGGSVYWLSLVSFLFITRRKKV